MKIEKIWIRQTRTSGKYQYFLDTDDGKNLSVHDTRDQAVREMERRNKEIFKK